MSLDEILGALGERGRAAWPDIELSGERFSAYLADAVAEEADPEKALGSLHIEDLYLACACAAGDARALAAFDSYALSGVREAVRHLDPEAAFASEVAQLTRMKLLVDGRIRSYRGRGKLKSWVQVTAVRIAIELCRKKKPEQSDDALAEAADLDEDPELVPIRQLYKEEFAAAFKTALASLSSRERNILRLYLLDGLNIDRIGAMYRVHRATVARWIAGAREKLLDGTRAELKQKLRLSETEFESLLVVVKSHLDLSLERFLGPAPTK